MVVGAQPKHIKRALLWQHKALQKSHRPAAGRSCVLPLLIPVFAWRVSPPSRHSGRPTSSHSSSPSSDSDDPDDSYVAMTTSSLSFSTGEPVNNAFFSLLLAMDDSSLLFHFIFFFFLPVSKAHASPGLRGRGQQPVGPASPRQQTGGVPGPGPPHGAIDTNKTGNNTPSRRLWG